MSKQIRLRNETYQRLDALRGKRETFDDTVNGLCNFYEEIKAIPDALGPSRYLNQRPKEEVRKDAMP